MIPPWGPPEGGKTWLHDGMDSSDDHYPTPKPEHTFATIWPEVKAAAEDTTCPWCKLPLIECACEEPEAEPVRCVECGAPLFECRCDERILEEEIFADQDAAAQAAEEEGAFDPEKDEPFDPRLGER